MNTKGSSKIRFVVIEGNDASGKSTLAAELRSTWRAQGWDTKHLGHRPGEQFHRYLREYASADRLIFNRAHVSELVYGRCLRGASPFSETQLFILDRLVQECGLIVYCCPTVEEIQTRLSKRNRTELFPSEPVDVSLLRQVSEEYETVFTGTCVIRYNPRSAVELDQLIAELSRLVHGPSLEPGGSRQ